jgi:hypothetical protein
MQGEKPESNENTYFQQFAQRNRPVHPTQIVTIPSVSRLLSTP